MAVCAARARRRQAGSGGRQTLLQDPGAGAAAGRRGAAGGGCAGGAQQQRTPLQPRIDAAAMAAKLLQSVAVIPAAVGPGIPQLLMAASDFLVCLGDDVTDFIYDSSDVVSEAATNGRHRSGGSGAGADSSGGGPTAQAAGSRSMACWEPQQPGDAAVAVASGFMRLSHIWIATVLGCVQLLNAVADGKTLPGQAAAVAAAAVELAQVAAYAFQHELGKLPHAKGDPKSPTYPNNPDIEHSSSRRCSTHCCCSLAAWPHRHRHTPALFAQRCGWQGPKPALPYMRMPCWLCKAPAAAAATALAAAMAMVPVAAAVHLAAAPSCFTSTGFAIRLQRNLQSVSSAHESSHHWRSAPSLNSEGELGRQPTVAERSSSKVHPNINCSTVAHVTSALQQCARSRAMQQASIGKS